MRLLLAVGLLESLVLAHRFAGRDGHSRDTAGAQEPELERLSSQVAELKKKLHDMELKLDEMAMRPPPPALSPQVPGLWREEGMEELLDELKEEFMSYPNAEEFFKQQTVIHGSCDAKDQDFCNKSAARLEAALMDPCQGCGCQSHPTVEEKREAALRACVSQKRRFVQWASVVCQRRHKEDPLKSFYDCISAGMNLLFATNDKAPAQEWAKAPRLKSNLVLWSRVTSLHLLTVLSEIPEGFILGNTLFGAVVELPEVDHFRWCTFQVQQPTWASNSLSLISEMPANQRVYFVSGANLLSDEGRPFGESVAFRVELPSLGRFSGHVAELVVLNVHPETKMEQLATAVRVAVKVPDDKLRIRVNDCSHCMDRVGTGCIARCVDQVKTFLPSMLEKVTGNATVLKRLIVKGDARLAAGLVRNGVSFDYLRNLTKHAIDPHLFVAPCLGELAKDDADLAERILRSMSLEQKDLNDLLFDSAFYGDGDVKLSRLLLRLGAEVNSIRSGFRPSGLGIKTPLAAAVKENHIELVQELLNAGAEINAAILGKTPLHFAAYKDMALVLLHAKADVDAPSNWARTPLHEALSHSQGIMRRDLVRALLDAKASVNVRDSEGRAPLFLAAQADVDVTKDLLQAGANVNSKTNHLETPLHRASWYGSKDVVKVLLEAKADVNSKNNAGLTPLELLGQAVKGDALELSFRRSKLAAWAHRFGDIVQALVNAKAEVNSRDQDTLSLVKVAEQLKRLDVVEAMNKAAKLENRKALATAPPLKL
ncbi:ANKRD50 [Symbiodinium sp. CCMP2456]|nr:ANKRD50 [Symbiodinium sp. CCMP2456]